MSPPLAATSRPAFVAGRPRIPFGRVRGANFPILMINLSSNERLNDSNKRLEGRDNVAESRATSTEFNCTIVEDEGKKTDRFLTQEPSLEKEPGTGNKNETQRQDHNPDQDPPDQVAVAHVEDVTDAKGRRASFTPDHDILTKEGWKPIGDATTSDEVVTLDPQTEEIEYQAPTDTHHCRHEGEMYRVESQQIDLKVAPGHKMYVNPRNPKINGKEYAGHRLMQAESIAGKRVRYKTDGAWTGTSSSTIQLDALDVGTGKGSNNQVLSDYATRTKVPTNALFELTGLFVAEGFTRVVASGNYRIEIVQDPEVHPDVYDRIVELFEACGASVYERPDRVIGVNKQLYAFMDNIPSGAANKRVPRWMLNYDAEHLKALFRGLHAGDGHEASTGYFAYTSISKGLCDDVQEIGVKGGGAARVFQQCEAGTSTFNGRKINQQACYKTHVRTKRLTPTINHSHVSEQDAQTEEWVEYSGTVHGCTVPNGVIYVRRNGKACWCGSSPEAQRGGPAESV